VLAVLAVAVVLALPKTFALEAFVEELESEESRVSMKTNSSAFLLSPNSLDVNSKSNSSKTFCFDNFLGSIEPVVVAGGGGRSMLGVKKKKNGVSKERGRINWDLSLRWTKKKINNKKKLIKIIIIITSTDTIHEL